MLGMYHEISGHIVWFVTDGQSSARQGETAGQGLFVQTADHGQLEPGYGRGSSPVSGYRLCS